MEQVDKLNQDKSEIMIGGHKVSFKRTRIFKTESNQIILKYNKLLTKQGADGHIDKEQGKHHHDGGHVSNRHFII